jgi:hypothetical protein
MFILAVDYDGTLFEGSYPDKGEPKQDIIAKVKQFQDAGAEIVLWTCRGGNPLKEAVTRCKEVGLEFDAINDNAPSNLEWIESERADGQEFCNPKIFANFYVDDRAANLDYFLEIDAEKTCNSHK